MATFLRSLGRLTLIGAALSITTYGGKTVPRTERNIPVCRRVDIVVVGGSVRGVAAALEAARQGAAVVLVESRPYLGEDMCSTLRLSMREDESAGAGLTAAIFGKATHTTPARVKKVLAKALVDADIGFLLGTYVTDVLRDESGEPAGVTVANRAGRQAIVAKVVIDATDRAWIARMAGCRMQSWPGGEIEVRRTVIGGDDSELEPERSFALPPGSGADDTQCHDYVRRIDLGDGSFPALARAEQALRDITYRKGQLRAAERLFYVPHTTISSRSSRTDWPGVRNASPDRFTPATTERLLVLGPCADVPAEVAAELLGPVGGEIAGRILGKQAAETALSLPAPNGVHVPGSALGGTTAGDVKEVLLGLRSIPRFGTTIPARSGGVPVLGEYDVVVIGGGTAGACAAIGAGRRGARVLVVEYQEGLGGVGTLGLIGKPYHGRDAGFSKEVPFPGKTFGIEDKMEWFRREIRKTGGDIWFGVLGCGAVVDNGTVTGAVVATPEGCGAVLARVVIDGTGNADIAVAAGADVMYSADGHDLAMQGTGLPQRPLKGHYVNTDYLLVDEADAIDVWRALTGALLTASDQAYDMGTLIQTRERRRVVGDHVMSYLDQIAGRTYSDSIVFSGSDYDSHGYPSDPYFALIPHDKRTIKLNHPAPGGTCYTPYRCLLPRGLEGMLVVGLGISMERDASAMVRMQRDMHNQGYAAGVAAAMATESRCGLRGIDVKALQKHLAELGSLPHDVLQHRDSFPLPADAVEAAVDRLQDYHDMRKRERVAEALAIVLSHPDAAHAPLLAAYRQADAEMKLVLARVLGFLGEKEAVPTLIEALEAAGDWDAKILQGKMAEYAHLPTPLDSLIMALGHTGDPRALPAILARLDTLDASVTLSHHRAVAMALENIADTAAAGPLAALLAKPDMRGHAMTKIEPLHNKQVDKRRRTGPLREIVIARALYRCGDRDGLGKQILGEYTHDIRGLFARHAIAVLAE